MVFYKSLFPWLSSYNSLFLLLYPFSLALGLAPSNPGSFWIFFCYWKNRNFLSTVDVFRVQPFYGNIASVGVKLLSVWLRVTRLGDWWSERPRGRRRGPSSSFFLLCSAMISATYRHFKGATGPARVWSTGPRCIRHFHNFRRIAPRLDAPVSQFQKRRTAYLLREKEGWEWGQYRLEIFMLFASSLFCKKAVESFKRRKYIA